MPSDAALPTQAAMPAHPLRDRVHAHRALKVRTFAKVSCAIWGTHAPRSLGAHAREDLKIVP